MSAVDAPVAPEGEVARLTVNLEATRLAVDVDADLLAVPDSSPARALAQVAESAPPTCSCSDPRTNGPSPSGRNRVHPRARAGSA
jgi:hypothetical protein